MVKQKKNFQETADEVEPITIETTNSEDLRIRSGANQEI